MDRSWSLLEQSFKRADEMPTIDDCSSGEDNDYEIQRVKRPKLISTSHNKLFEAHKKSVKGFSQNIFSCTPDNLNFVSSNRHPLINNLDSNVTEQNSQTIVEQNTQMVINHNEIVNENSSDDLFDDKSISPCSSPSQTQFSSTLSSISLAMSTSVEKVKKKKFVKNGLAMKCQGLVNQQKSLMFLMNYSDAEENTTDFIVDKKIEEYGKVFIHSKDDIALLRPEQAKLYNIGDSIKITNSTEFISVRPLDTILNIYLNVCHIISK